MTLCAQPKEMIPGAVRTCKIGLGLIHLSYGYKAAERYKSTGIDVDIEGMARDPEVEALVAK